MSMSSGGAGAPDAPRRMGHEVWLPAPLLRPVQSHQLWHCFLHPVRWGPKKPYFAAAWFSRIPQSPYSYRSLDSAILNSDRMNVAIRNEAAEVVRTQQEHQMAASIGPQSPSKRVQTLDEAIAVVKKHATAIVAGMAARTFRALLRLSAWFLHKALSRSFTGIIVSDEQIARLPRDVPLVLLPTHKSHVDYILVSLICYIYDIKMPHIAAGDNLNIPFFGGLARRHGAFFIRRKGNPSSELYRSILREYVIQALMDGSNVEVFLEGGRSRNGRPMPPKMGLLSSVVEVVDGGVVDDVMVVPVGISYDTVPEAHTYPNQLLGAPKAPESFWASMQAIINALRTNYGNVYIDFGNPISVRDFIATHHIVKERVHSTLSLLDVVSVGSAADAPLVPLTSSVSSRALLIRDLATLSLRQARDVATVPDASLVAMLLCTLHRDAVSMTDLEHDFAWMRQLVQGRGFSTSANIKLPAQEAARTALQLLGDNLAITSIGPNGTHGTYVQLPPHLERRIAVSFYANQSSHVFVYEAVLLTAALTLGHAFDDRTLRERTMRLCNLLESEYLLYPDSYTHYSLNAALMRLSDSGILVLDKSDALDNRFQCHVGEAVASPYARMLLLLLRPAIDSYCVALDRLSTFENGPAERGAFLEDLQAHAFELFSNGRILFAESCALDMLQRSVDTLVRWHVLTLANPEEARMGVPLSRATSFLKMSELDDPLSASAAQHESPAALAAEIARFQVPLPHRPGVVHRL